MYYKEEKFPEHIKFMKGTERELVENILGEASIICDNQSYIEINLNEKSWRTCFGFEWLYRNKPPLITIEELKNLISK